MNLRTTIGFRALALAAATGATPLLGAEQATQPARMVVPDEPDWNAAEDLNVAGKFDQATDGYLRVLRVSTKGWLKARAAGRLLEVAPKASRWEAAVAGYLAMVKLDPGKALAVRPALPETDSTYVDTALAETRKALAEPNLTGEQRQALLGLQLDLYRVRKDDAKADATLAQLNGTLSADAAGPTAVRRFADLKLSTARLAVERGEFDKAIEELRAARTAFTEAGQQEEALFMLGQAAEGRATKAGDDGGLKDAALAYMRVVTHFQDVPDNRRVAAALVRTGAILEKLGATKQAADLYRQVAIQYTTRPEAKAAAEQVKRLEASADSK